MKRIVSIALALLCMAGISMAQNALTVPDTNVPQGRQGEMVVNFQFVAEDEIAAYQFELALPEGVSLVPNGKRYYYEYMRGERALSPEQQGWIRNLFDSFGYQDCVVFDRLEPAFNFPWI